MTIITEPDSFITKCGSHCRGGKIYECKSFGECKDKQEMLVLKCNSKGPE